MLLGINQTLRERDVERESQTKESNIQRYKKAAEEPWLFEQVAEDTDNREGVLEICLHHDYFLPCQN